MAFRIHLGGGMTLRWCSNARENALFAELSKDTPSKEMIRQLINDGVSIETVNRYGDSVLSFAIGQLQHGFPVEMINYLIDLGANPKSTPKRLNYLFDAYQAESPEALEILLKKGVDPNLVDEETLETLFDVIQSDLSHERQLKSSLNSPMRKLMFLLLRFGGRSATDLTAETPEYFLCLNPYTQTGLFTKEGNLEPENLELNDHMFYRKLRNWKSQFPLKEIDMNDLYRIPKVPVLLDSLRKHRMSGYRLASQIKDKVTLDLRIEFRYLDLKQWEDGKTIQERIIL